MPLAPVFAIYPLAGRPSRMTPPRLMEEMPTLTFEPETAMLLVTMALFPPAGISLCVCHGSANDSHTWSCAEQPGARLWKKRLPTITALPYLTIMSPPIRNGHLCYNLWMPKIVEKWLLFKYVG